MRLERTASSPKFRTLKSSSKKSSSGTTEAESGNLPQEQLEIGPDPESSKQVEAQEEERFPGVRAGLPDDYLKAPQKSQAPTTLMASSPAFHLPESGFSLLRLPEYSSDKISACSGVLHLREALKKLAQDWPKGDEREGKLQRAFRDEGFLANRVQCRFEHPGFGALFERYRWSYFAHRYACRMSQQCQRAFQKYLGDIYLEFPLVVQVSKAEKNNAGHEWIQGKHYLSLELKEKEQDESLDWQERKTEGPYGGSHPFRRGVSDLISFVHGVCSRHL